MTDRKTAAVAEKAADRCTGHCCRRFPLPYSHEELIRRASTICDGEFIADMVIPLGETVRHPNGGHEMHMFTCRHFDTDSGNCREYARRPKMCVEYPYGRQCEYAECTASPETLAAFSRPALLVLAEEARRDPDGLAAKLSGGVR